MVAASVSVSAEYPASVDRVWSIVSDHEGTPTWVPKVKQVTLLEPGIPRNGAGAVRRVSFRPALWSTIDERVVRYDEGARFDYTIFAGMPGVKRHLGSLQVHPDGDGSRLTWDVEFEFAWWWAPFAGPFARTFEAALEEGLATLRGTLDAGA